MTCSKCDRDSVRATLLCTAADCPKHTATYEGALTNVLTCVDQLKNLISRGYTLANEPTTLAGRKQTLYRLVESLTDTVGRLEVEGRLL